jgi:hypothetical protein
MGIGFRETGYEDENFTQPIQGRIQYWGSFVTLINLRVL